MKKAGDKPTDNSSGQITPGELAHLAVAVAHWRRQDRPAFAEAEEIIEGARRHLSGDRQINSKHDYYKELERLGVNRSQLTPEDSASLPPEVDEIVRALSDGKPHPKIEEPSTFPVSMILCLTLITGEKDPRRRSRWLEKAGVQEKRAKIEDVFLYRFLAARLVPHLPKFGAVYPKRKPASFPRDDSGRFIKAGIQRGARGRAKRITKRDHRGRIAKNRA